MNGLSPFASFAAYSASTFAVLGLSDALREELAPAMRDRDHAGNMLDRIDRRLFGIPFQRSEYRNILRHLEMDEK